MMRLWMVLPVVMAMPMQAFAQAPSPAPAAARLLATCPTTRNLTGANWDARMPGTETLDKLEASTRGPGASPAVPDDAAFVLRSFAGPSETLDEPTESVATVWRDRERVWHVDKVDYRSSRAAGDTVPQRSRIVGEIDPIDAAQLERLVSDPCLYVEPQSPGVELFVRDRVWPDDPCYSGAGGTVELRRRDGGRKVFSLLCPRLLAGDLLRVALYPQLRGGNARHGYPQSFATIAEARAQAAKAMKANQASADWQNVTATPVPELRHLPSGFHCRLHGANGSLYDFNPSGRRFSASCGGGEATGLGDINTSAALRPQGTESLEDLALLYAPTSYYNAAPSKDVLRRAVAHLRIDGQRLATLAVIEGPRADARREHYARLLVGRRGAYTVAVTVVGLTSARDEIDRRARAEWQWVKAHWERQGGAPAVAK